jgi:hypothetical protein
VDTALELVGIVAEVVFLVLLTRKHVYRRLPVFYVYLWWGLLGDVVMLYLRHHYPHHYLQIYIGEMSLDSALQYGVLVELLWSVLKPFGDALPRGTVLGISILVIALGGAAWPFSNLQTFAAFPFWWHILARLQQSISILRILFFLVLAGSSNFLRIGWRDRELQVVTGLGFYSLVGLTASVLHSHQTLGGHYHLIDLMTASSYLVSLVYWIVSFAQQEAPRREFTPEMQSFLSAVAGNAAMQRAQMAEINASRLRG